jgi:hypothetical protein
MTAPPLLLPSCISYIRYVTFYLFNSQYQKLLLPCLTTNYPVAKMPTSSLTKELMQDLDIEDGKFEKFKHLPTELRHMIWLRAATPRIRVFDVTDLFVMDRPAHLQASGKREHSDVHELAESCHEAKQVLRRERTLCWEGKSIQKQRVSFYVEDLDEMADIDWDSDFDCPVLSRRDRPSKTKSFARYTYNESAPALEQNDHILQLPPHWLRLTIPFQCPEHTTQTNICYIANISTVTADWETPHWLHPGGLFTQCPRFSQHIALRIHPYDHEAQLARAPRFINYLVQSYPHLKTVILVIRQCPSRWGPSRLPGDVQQALEDRGRCSTDPRRFGPDPTFEPELEWVVQPVWRPLSAAAREKITFCQVETSLDM